MNFSNNYKMTDMTKHQLFYPDRLSVSSEISLAEWDARAVAALIRSKCVDGKSPTFLFLGRREAAMLKENLAEVFGEESVVTLNGTYYMGLNVKTIRCESFFAIGGSKTNRPQDAPCRMEWRDSETESLWQCRI